MTCPSLSRRDAAAAWRACLPVRTEQSDAAIERFSVTLCYPLQGDPGVVTAAIAVV